LRAFRRLTWREGPGGKLSSRFAFRRVKVANDDGTDAGDREPMWLVMEWPEGEAKPTKFILTTLPRRMNKKQIVRIVKERWRTERAYEELKGELGLDHFEGRSFPGWHHHISVVLCCYSFLVSERVRHFPPSARREDPAHSISLAA
jgi:SRSO17 transposase